MKKKKLQINDIFFSDDTLKVTAKLTEVNTLPYQETQTFKDVICEFRKKAEIERPLILLSQRADKCKELKQLFPRKIEDRKGITVTSRLAKATVDRFKVKIELSILPITRKKYNKNIL